jgi:hypothetical protein
MDKTIEGVRMNDVWAGPNRSPRGSREAKSKHKHLHHKSDRELPVRFTSSGIASHKITQVGQTIRRKSWQDRFARGTINVGTRSAQFGRILKVAEPFG